MKVVPLLKERARTFAEARAMLVGELSFLFEEPHLDQGKLLAQEPSEQQGMTEIALKSLSKAVKALPEGVSPEAVKEVVMPLADTEETKGKGGRGAVLWPLRYGLSGQDRSPDPFTIISIIGPKDAVSRIDTALAILKG